MAVEPFIGEIMMWGGNYAPRGWAFCNGQTLSIAQNTALFCVIGTQYGGDGRVTFSLPDFRGRMPLGANNINAMTRRDPDITGGAVSVVLPTRTHQTVTPAGQTVAAQPSDGKVDLLPPYLCVSFVIALQGLFPPRQ